MNVARLEVEFVAATERAAIAAGRLIGYGEANAIDGAAVDAMRATLHDADVAGTVVIGEGEKDAAPMLYHGEFLGTGDGPAVDIAVDPIDGTKLAARGGAGAISVVAAARRGSLFRTRVPYMEKIVCGPAGVGVVTLERPLSENLRLLAKAAQRDVADLTVALLDRPRNEPLLADVRSVGARVKLFTDGDVAMTVQAVLADRSRVDVVAGIGGAPEGVISACMVRALGGAMEARLWFRDEHDEAIARDEGNRAGTILRLRDLCAGDEALFAATGVTDGELLAGVRYHDGAATTQSLVISTYTRSVRWIEARHTLRPAETDLGLTRRPEPAAGNRN